MVYYDTLIITIKMAAIIKNPSVIQNVAIPFNAIYIIFLISFMLFPPLEELYHRGVDMKRFMFLFIVFLLVFSSPISVYAASDNANDEQEKTDISGYDSWSDAEKRAFWSTEFFSIVGASADLVLRGNVSANKQAIEDVFSDMSHVHEYDSYDDFLARNVTTDSSGNLVFNDDVLAFLNAVLDKLKTENTYQYGYFPTNAYLSASSFNSKNTYETISRLISLYPDKVFRIQSSSIPGLDTEKGNTDGVAWSWASGWKLTVYDIPYGAVGSPVNISSSTPTSVNCYTEDWLLDFSTAFEVYVVDWSGQSFLCFWDKEGNYYEILDYKSLSSGCIDNAYAVPVWASNINKKLNSVLAFSPAYFSQSNLPPVNLYCFSNYSGGIPVFNSLADLKNGTEGKSPLQTLPGYSGQPVTKNTISQKEINDYSTNYNYYYGDGSGGSGGSGGGSGSGSGGGSSGNWVESIIKGLGSFFDGILTIVGKFIELLGKLVEMISGAFSNLMDIVPSDFADFLTALFPMVPAEWITAATLFITLALFGVLIKLFTK